VTGIITRPYNGFDHAARKVSVLIQNEAFRTGVLKRPDTCSICRFSDPEDLDGRGYIFAHLEDYRRPLEILPCCKRCHTILHARFVRPTRFLQLVACHGFSGCWFGGLTMDPTSQARPFDEIYRLGLPAAGSQNSFILG
jgi:hypothetical protein